MSQNYYSICKFWQLLASHLNAMSFILTTVEPACTRDLCSLLWFKYRPHTTKAKIFVEVSIGAEQLQILPSRFFRKLNEGMIPLKNLIPLFLMQLRRVLPLRFSELAPSLNMDKNCSYINFSFCLASSLDKCCAYIHSFLIHFLTLSHFELPYFLHFYIGRHKCGALSISNRGKGPSTTIPIVNWWNKVES